MSGHNQINRDLFRQLRHLPEPYPQIKRPIADSMISNLSNTWASHHQQLSSIHQPQRGISPSAIQGYAANGPSSWSISRIGEVRPVPGPAPGSAVLSPPKPSDQPIGNCKCPGPHRFLQRPTGPYPSPLSSPAESEIPYAPPPGCQNSLRQSFASLPQQQTFTFVPVSYSHPKERTGSQSPTPHPSTPVPFVGSTEQENQSKPNTPAIPSVESVEQGDQSKTNPPPVKPNPPPVSTATASENMASINRGPVIPMFPSESAILTEFEIITAHTAKCDLCNKRNGSGMSRCLTCGWQSCHACTIANSCFRTHRAGGRVHTGPVAREDLASSDNTKGKKRTRAQQKASETAVARRPRAQSKTTEPAPAPKPVKPVKRSRVSYATGNLPEEPRPALPALQSTNTNEQPPLDFDKLPASLEGARDLYAFSIKTRALAEREEKEKEKRLSGQHADTADDDTTEIMSNDGGDPAQATNSDELHAWAFKQADYAIANYLKDRESVETSEASKSVSSQSNTGPETGPENDAPKTTQAKTKAQVYERRRAGTKVAR